MTLGKVEGVSLIQSNFGQPRHLELIAQVEGQLAFFWRDSGETQDLITAGTDLNSSQFKL